MVFGLLCWLIDSPSRAPCLLVLGKPALQILHRVVTQRQIIRRDLSRRKSLPALPVAAALGALARFRRGPLVLCQFPRRLPEGRNRPGECRNWLGAGRDAVSGVLAAPVPAAPEARTFR
jgi:hypothetical protein